MALGGKDGLLKIMVMMAVAGVMGARIITCVVDGAVLSYLVVLALGLARLLLSLDLFHVERF